MNDLDEKMQQLEESIRKATDMMENVQKAEDLKSIAILLEKLYAARNNLITIMDQREKDAAEQRFKDKEFELKENEFHRESQKMSWEQGQKEFYDQEELNLRRTELELDRLKMEIDHKYRKLGFGLDIAKVAVPLTVLGVGTGFSIVSMNDGLGDRSICKGIVDFARMTLQKASVT